MAYKISPFKWADFKKSELPKIKLNEQIYIINTIFGTSTLIPKFLLTTMLSTNLPRLDFNQFKLQIEAKQ